MRGYAPPGAERQYAPDENLPLHGGQGAGGGLAEGVCYLVHNGEHIRFLLGSSSIHRIWSGRHRLRRREHGRVSSDGSVSVHIEHGSKAVFSDSHRVTYFYEFEDRFRDFKAKIVRPSTATWT